MSRSILRSNQTPTRRRSSSSRTSPKSTTIWAISLGGIGRLAEAIAAFRRAIEINSTYAEAWANLGAVLCDGGDGESAIKACRRAIELRPDLAIAHSNYALILLRLGQYEIGWPEHEWRFKCNARFRPRSFAQPRWDGTQLDGRTILLHAEQGWGDTIQFVRYAPMVAERGGRVILECQAELMRLLGRLPGVEQTPCRSASRCRRLMCIVRC